MNNTSENLTIRYDSVYLRCSEKLTGSQLSPPHGGPSNINTYKRISWTVYVSIFLDSGVTSYGALGHVPPPWSLCKL